MALNIPCETCSGDGQVWRPILGHEDCGCGGPIDCPDCEGTGHEPLTLAVLNEYYGAVFGEETKEGFRFRKDGRWDFYKQVDSCLYAYREATNKERYAP